MTSNEHRTVVRKSGTFNVPLGELSTLTAHDAELKENAELLRASICLSPEEVDARESLWMERHRALREREAFLAQFRVTA